MKFTAISCWTEEFDALPGGDKKFTLMMAFEWASRVFQKQYDEMLKEAPVVWTDNDRLWITEPNRPCVNNGVTIKASTHQARLVDIRPIGKESGE